MVIFCGYFVADILFVLNFLSNEFFQENLFHPKNFDAAMNCEKRNLILDIAVALINDIEESIEEDENSLFVLSGIAATSKKKNEQHLKTTLKGLYQDIL